MGDSQPVALTSDSPSWGIGSDENDSTGYEHVTACEAIRTRTVNRACEDLCQRHDDATNHQGPSPPEALDEVYGRGSKDAIGDGKDERDEVGIIHARGHEESRAVAEPEGDASCDGEK